MNLERLKLNRRPAKSPAGIIMGLVLLAALVVPFARADEHVFTVQDPTPPPFEVRHDWQYRVPLHTGKYEPLHLEWQTEERVPDASNVFADPHVPAHMLVASAAGLMETWDHGRSWAALPEASADKMGVVNCVVFRPDSLLTFYVGSQTRGLWMTANGGKTFRQLATKASGLAADAVANIFLYPADRSRRTLLLTYGEEAPGVSRSIDAGATWQVLYPDYHISQITFSGESPELFLAGSAVGQPDVRSIYYLPSPDEPWQTLLSDVNCVSSFAPLLPRDALYFATSDKGFFRISANGGIAVNVGPLREQQWASLGCTFGRTADSQLFYGYDPKQLGLVLFTTDQLDPKSAALDGTNTAATATPYTTQSQGLFTGPLVMDGARIVANANGTAFYAVANKILYVAHDTTSSIMVREVAVDPPLHLLEPEVVRSAYGKINQALDTFSSDRNLLNAAAVLQPQLQEQVNTLARFSVTATITFPNGHPPKSVTVDLSRLGLSERSPLFDDGKHNDGVANDGVYANSFSFDSINLENLRGDWRTLWPGPMGLTVSAVGQDGTLSGAVGVFTLCRRTRSLPFNWYMPNRDTGDVKGDGVWDQKYGNMPHISVASAGPWSVDMPVMDPRPTNISGCYALTFQIRATHETTDDLVFQFQDMPTYAFRHKSDPVAMIKEGYLPSGKITTQFQRVTIPMSRILRDGGKFDPSTVQDMFISSTAGGPREYFLHDLHLCPTEEDVPTDQVEK